MSTAADHRIKTSTTFNRLGVIAVAAATLSLGGCAGAGGDVMAGLLAKPGQPAAENAQAEAGGTELEKATQYWAKEFASKPTDLRTVASALNFNNDVRLRRLSREKMVDTREVFCDVCLECWCDFDVSSGVFDFHDRPLVYGPLHWIGLNNSLSFTRTGNIHLIPVFRNSSARKLYAFFT